MLNAALLGETEMAASMVLARAKISPASGYRFPGCLHPLNVWLGADHENNNCVHRFAPHEQDYEPSADHFANMNSALNWMLLQPADDAHGSALAFAAWPCDWDVNFKLWAPRNTLVEAELSGDIQRLREAARFLCRLMS